MSTDRQPASSIVDKLREADVLIHVVMLARVTVASGKEKIIVHTGYHRCSLPNHAEDEARKAILLQLVGRRDQPKIPQVVFDTTTNAKSGSRHRQSLDDLIDPIAAAIEFHVLESRSVLPEEIDGLYAQRPFAENNLKIA